MRLTQWDLGLVAALAALSFAYAGLFSFSMPYFDHWDVAPLIEAAAAGALAPERLFEIHGGHWHAGAYAVLVPLALASGWSHQAEALASACVMAGCCVLALKLASAAAPAGARFTPYAVAAALLAFSLDQAGNLLLGFQLSLFISQFGVFLALAALLGDGFGPLRFGIALTGLALAVSAYATGFALVPIGLTLLMLRSDVGRMARVAYALGWAIVSAALCVAFVASLKGAPHGGGFDASDLRHPDFAFYLAQFLLNLIGAGVTRFSTSLILPVAVIGVALPLAMTAALVRKATPLRQLAIPLALCAYGVGAGLLCGLGRYDFGPEQGVNTRYFTFANAYWLGVVMLSLMGMQALVSQPLRRGLIALLVLLSLLKVGNSVQQAVKHAELSAEIAAVAEAMRANPSEAAAIARVYAYPRQDVERHVAFLRERRWSMYKDAAP